MTKADKERQARLRDLGCVACFVQSGVWGTPASIHHIAETGRRLGEDYVLPLCPDHHKGAPKCHAKISFHHNKAKFEAAYGTQQELLDLVNEKLVGHDNFGEVLNRGF